MTRCLSLVCAILAFALVGTTSVQATAPVAGYNAGSNATAALGASLFNKIFGKVVPVIEKIGLNFTIPFIRHLDNHFNVWPIHFSEFKIGSLDAAFVTPNKVTIGLNDFTIQVPSTHFDVYILDEEEKKQTLAERALAGAAELLTGKKKVNPSDMGCSGELHAGITGAAFNIDVVLSTNAEGKLSAQVLPTTFNIGDVDFDYSMNNFFCKGLEVLKLFKGLIIKLLTKEINKEVPGKITTLLQGILDKDLPKLPLTFASQPVVVDDHLELNAELIAPWHGPGIIAPGGSKVLQNYPGSKLRPPLMAQPHIFTDRDITLGITAASLDDFFYAGAAGLLQFNHTFPEGINLFKLFLPAAYQKCPGCPLNVAFDMNHYPPAILVGTDCLHFRFNNALLTFTALDNSTNAPVSLFGIYADLDFSPYNVSMKDDKNGTTLLHFDLQLNKFNLTQGPSSVGPVDPSKFAALVQGVLQGVIVPLFNKGFKGLPITLDKDGFGLDELEVSIQPDAIALGLNLLLPKGTGAEAVGAGMAAVLRGKH